MEATVNITARNVIRSYFDLGEALSKRYKELVPSLSEPGARTEVRDQSRKEIPKTRIGDEALRKRRESRKGL